METVCSSASALHSDFCPQPDTVCIVTQRETDDSVQPQFPLPLPLLRQSVSAALREHGPDAK